MCTICLKSPCDIRCPSAPEKKTACVCKTCGDGIDEGQEYAKIDDDYHHIECLDDMTTRELLMLFGVETFTAEEDDRW